CVATAVVADAAAFAAVSAAIDGVVVGATLGARLVREGDAYECESDDEERTAESRVRERENTGIDGGVTSRHRRCKPRPWRRARQTLMSEDAIVSAAFALNGRDTRGQSSSRRACTGSVHRQNAGGRCRGGRAATFSSRLRLVPWLSPHRPPSSPFRSRACFSWLCLSVSCRP